MPPARRRGFLPALLLACASLSAAAAAEPKVRVIDYGLYEVTQSGSQVTADRTLTGKIDMVGNIRLVRRTEKLIAQIGTSFGIRIDLEEFPPGPATLTIRAIHPRITNPETGVARAVSEYDTSVTDRRNLYFGYGIRKRWHINEGLWTVQVIYQGKVLAQRRFELLVPLN